MEIISKILGYDNYNQFLNSTFHPDSSIATIGLTAGLTGAAVVIENTLGLNLPTITVLIILFTLELITGIKASKKEGADFNTNTFTRGWVKLFIYVIMIGCTNILALYGPAQGRANPYVIVHYIFTNYVLINLIISNLENFIRLGWEDKYGITKKVAEFLNLKVLKINKIKKDEGEISE